MVQLKKFQCEIIVWTFQKLHVMKAEISNMEDRSSNGSEYVEAEQDYLMKKMNKKMRKHADEISTVHQGLERKIFARHSELW